MSVFRWGNPISTFQDLEREVDRWFRSMDLAIEGLRLGRPFPALNLFDTGESYLITAELPGCHVDDLELQVAGGILTLKGRRLTGTEVPDERFRRSERPNGNWERKVSLPERVDEDHIRADLTDGLLRLHLPKLPSGQPRRIEVSKKPLAPPDAQEGSVSSE
ncbi:MAG: Hsp20/alpha crystallin family protein [Planctomycetaceae bacterium]|nr:Hsp20/alpha crystallin family protein [Planctomycetaceae bacterium]